MNSIMKYPCETVKDLLPLYHDGVCSDSSKKIVEEHLAECESCRNDMKRIGNDTYENQLKTEKDSVVGHYAQKVKRKSLVAGLTFASVLCVPIIVCLIVNLAVGRSLDWFFIVLTSLMVLGSLTVVPLVAETKKGVLTLGSFTLSLMLLLLTCCLYVGGDWFFAAAVPVLFGLSVVFLPYVIYCIPLRGFASRHKGLIVMATDTGLLYAVIIVSGLYFSHSNNYWKIAFLSASINLLFPWFLFAVIRYLKTNSFIRAGICVLVSGIWIPLINDIENWIRNGITGISSFDNVNLFVWNASTIDGNVSLIILLSGLAIGVGLLAVGLVRKQKSKI